MNDRHYIVLGQLKRLFGFSHMMLWKNLSKLVGQPNKYIILFNLCSIPKRKVLLLSSCYRQ